MSKLITIAALAIISQNHVPRLPANLETSMVEQLREDRSGGLLHGVAEHSAQVRSFEIVQITQASAVITLDQATVFIDPVGSQSQYARFGRPDIVVLTRVHPDHLSIDTMIGMLRRDTVVLAPQAVIDQLPLMISNNTVAPFAPGTSQEVNGIKFSALPLSASIPSTAEVFPRDRGDIAVLLEVDGALVSF